MNATKKVARSFATCFVIALASFAAAAQVIDPQLFGAKCDGSTDDTSALAKAIAATPVDGVLQLPADKTCVVSSIATGRRIRIKGYGYHTVQNAAFGAGAWLTMSNHAGSILKCTATSGVCVKHSVPRQSPMGLSIEDVFILGPGSGTSIGLQIGHANGEGASAPLVRNVLVANFATCFKAEFNNGGTYIGLANRGCSTGRTFTNDSNNNTDIGGEVQVSSVDAILLDNSKGNTFQTMLIQGITGKGVRAVNNSYNNKFFNPWFENAGAVTDIVDASSAIAFGIYGGTITGGNIRFGSAGGRLDGVYIVSTTNVELTRGAAGFISIASRIVGGGRLTNNSPSATFLDHNGLATTEVSTGTLRWEHNTEPACNSGNRGKVIMVQGGAGVADTFRICAKDAAGAYAYRALF